MATDSNIGKSPNRRGAIIGMITALLVLASWYAGLFLAPVDVFQGDVYRIIYLHVPVAFAAFFSALVLCLISIAVLLRPTPIKSLWAQASAEVGLLLTILTLLTGMIWGKPTWGVYWTWDARLTTTLLLALMYAGYLLLKSAMTPGATRDKACAAFGILIFADVPIIYKSVTWWRTLHQPQTLIRAGGSTIDPDMRNIVVTCIVVLLFFVGWLIAYRTRNLQLKMELERRQIASVI